MSADLSESDEARRRRRRRRSRATTIPTGWAGSSCICPGARTDFETEWARVAAPMAGKDRGAFFLPEVGDEVLVAFDRRRRALSLRARCPVEPPDPPPEKNADGKNNIRIIKTRKGHILKFDDSDRGSILIQLDDGEEDPRSTMKAY